MFGEQHAFAESLAAELAGDENDCSESDGEEHPIHPLAEPFAFNLISAFSFVAPQWQWCAARVIHRLRL